MKAKVKRFMYMLIACILLAPIIVFGGLLWFVYLLYLSRDIKKTAVVWYKYVRSGIVMNIDFIKNGF